MLSQSEGLAPRGNVIYEGVRPKFNLEKKERGRGQRKREGEGERVRAIGRERNGGMKLELGKKKENRKMPWEEKNISEMDKYERAQGLMLKER